MSSDQYQPIKSRTIQVRMTKGQYERIKNNTEVRGFTSLSCYMRFVALDQDLVLFNKVSEIHAHLIGAGPKGWYKKNPAANR